MGNYLTIPGYRDLDNLVYQILIVEEDKKDYEDFELGLTRKLYIGTTNQLKDELKYLSDEQKKSIDKLPYPGINMEKIFPDINGESFLEVEGKYHVVRRLFQARKLSQLIAKSWIKNKDIKKQDEGQNQESYTEDQNKRRLRTIRKLFLTGDRVLHPQDEVEWLVNYEDIDPQEEPYIITPEQENWQSICLNLLFCGQAYLKYDREYIPLWVPILSTYEASCFYAFSVDFDSFTGTIGEIYKKGTRNPRPPYYTASIPYPPRPRTDGDLKILRNRMIKEWAHAEDVSDNKNELSFCKEGWTDENGIEIKFVVPPYPYLPMSCSC